MKNITLKIGGMTCSACSNSLEKFLKKQPGIIDASVNLVMASASITYEDHLKMDDLNSMVRKSGFIPQGIFKLDQEHKNYKAKLIHLIIFASLAIVLMYITMGNMFSFPLPSILQKQQYPIIYGIVLASFAVVFIGYGSIIIKNGFKNIFYLSPNMDTLVTLGVLVSFIYSTVNLILLITNNISDANNLYFESCCIVIVFVQFGRLIDQKAKEKTKEAIKDLVQITPKYAKVKINNEIKEVTIDEVNKGDILVAFTGDKIAVDGKVVSGEAHTNESFLTGESMPSKKENGSSVIAGAIVLDGYIEYEAERIGRESTISEIVNLVVDATNTKTNISRIADKVSLFFVPAIIAIAILTGIIYLIIGKDIKFVMNIFTSVLLVACPCALGLATPLAIVISEGRLARSGILVKKSITLENANKINTIIFDKTGTLTYGDLKISKIFNFDGDYIQYACSLEAKANHPIASCFVKYAKEINLELIDATNISTLPGIGVEGYVNSKKVSLGNNKIFDYLQLDNPYLEQEMILKQSGHTIVYVIIDDEVKQLIGIKDVIRENAKDVISQLKDMGIKVIMLSGDNNETANIVAQELGIKHVISNVLPKQKVEIVESHVKNNKVVAMVGDGINDAPALAKANIGISINSGTDIAINASDVILMHNDLSSIVELLNISKKTIINIKENLFWAFIYNIFMIPIAMGLFANLGLVLNPMIASIGMMVSSLCVTLNALRLIKRKNKGE